MDPTFLITDIKEKEVTEPKAPSFPQIKSTGSGFPEHKKRTRISAFKQKRQTQETKQQVSTATSTSSRNEPSSALKNGNESREAQERRRIDRENNDRLASMSPEEVEAARQELFGSLDTSTLERLLKRANLDETKGPSPFDNPEADSQHQPQERQEPQEQHTQASPPDIRIEDTSSKNPDGNSQNFKATVEDEQEEEDGQEQPESTAAAAAATNSSAKKRVRFESSDPPVEDEQTEPTPQPQPKPQPETDNDNDNDIDNTAPPLPPPEQILHPTDPSITRPHWPRPPQPDTDGADGSSSSSTIDPSDPDFLSKLHQKYFPSLPADPSKLAWMAPVPTPNSAADLDSPYHPSQASVSASALRFDFRGALLPPRVARAVPTTKGLHHHGEAPEAAGYTIPELARLARSAVPGQRCVAYQTLGRILYRLGRAEFGRPGDDMAGGLWALCREGAVLRSLNEEASLEEGRGHRSARAFAIEAVWLFEKGGWGERVRRGK